MGAKDIHDPDFRGTRAQRGHVARLLRNIAVETRGISSAVWTNRLGSAVCVYDREDAGVDGDEPWVASCELHNEMIACATKASATSAARHSAEWCSGCQADRAADHGKGFPAY